MRVNVGGSSSTEAVYRRTLTTTSPTYVTYWGVYMNPTD